MKSSFDERLTLWYKVNVKPIRRTLAIIELLLVFPAVLFMAAVFLRAVQPLAGTGLLIDWFSHHVVLGLYVFLIVMPLAAFAVGCAMVLHSWRGDSNFRHAVLDLFTIVRTHLAPMLIAVATLMAGGVLAMVALHLVTE